ncbi:MAG: LPS export ABC transporter periplasmic protein LptC [Candidatus Thiodiazotropha sp. (ex Dulcina madagascariensis)]|nr:LPS export ABC transporter periplasmic protein LptC [Candidatus Thiodiazotropha sp. (ex Dulcina madagascariensis)]MCU7924955.1 LPS export ABC transporter periplasmic protein LptC [Candidatus Thiodiazotropha sp. (ex Dulcina madagascariensis)]
MKRRLLGILLMLAGLLSLGWWMNEIGRSPEKPPRAAGTSPDAYAEGLVVWTYDENGLLKRKMVTPGMRHFEQPGITELQRPLLMQFNPASPPWTMRAEEGIARSGDETLFFPGNVTLERPGNADLAPYRVTTRDLTVALRTEFASTPRAVRIESDGQWVTAQGMEAWLDRPMRLKLLRQVRGYYDFE